MQSVLELIALNWSLARALVRSGGFVSILPSFGLIGGARSRLLFGIVLALIIGSGCPSSSESVQPGDMILVIGAEIANGLALGFTIRVVFASIQIVAQMVEQQIGLINLANSEDQIGSAIDRLYQLVSLSVFVALSGHRFVMAALLHVSVVGNTTIDAATWTDAAARLVTASWYLAIQSVLPLVISLLSAQLAAGMIARVVPSLSGSTVMVPTHVMVGFILILLSLASVSVTFMRGVEWSIQAIHQP